MGWNGTRLEYAASRWGKRPGRNLPALWDGLVRIWTKARGVRDLANRVEPQEWEADGAGSTNIPGIRPKNAGEARNPSVFALPSELSQ